MHSATNHSKVERDNNGPLAEAFMNKKPTARSRHAVALSGQCSDESKKKSQSVPLLILLKEFDDIIADEEIPRFLEANDSTLRFPEKVSPH